MGTLYDHIFSKSGPAGRVYVTHQGQRYVIDYFSLEGNSMKINFGAKRATEPILPHLHDGHVVSLTRADLEKLTAASRPNH
jgi:hypothetical protein